MKKLLVLFMTLTSISALAAADDFKEYSFESVACSVVTGALTVATPELSPQSSLLLEAEFDAVLLNRDNSKMDLEQKVDGKLQKMSFKLNQIGKTSFMAIPVVVTPDMNQMFVKIDEDRSELEISRSDFMGKYCGGGLVIKTFTIESQKTP